jgi:hypothetical protein
MSVAFGALMTGAGANIVAAVIVAAMSKRAAHRSATQAGRDRYRP